MKNSVSPARRAFTLIELLVVMGIIVLMGALVVPAVGGALKGTALNQGAQLLQAQFNAAQQNALAKGQTIEMRLLMCGDPDSPTVDKDDKTTWKLRGIQLFSVQSVVGSSSTLNYVPVTKLEFLPSTVVINRNISLSTLCDNDLTSGLLVAKNSTEDSTHPKLPRIGLNYQYYKIDFRADGSTSLKPNKSWFVTLNDLNKGDDLTVPPSNFFTIALDPVQGSNRAFRPM